MRSIHNVQLSKGRRGKKNPRQRNSVNIHKHKRIAALKRLIRNNVVDGRGQIVPEPTCGLGVAVIFVVDPSNVAEGLAVLDEEKEEETDETMGFGVTSSVEEFWAFEYEEPPPKT